LSYIPFWLVVAFYSHIIPKQTIFMYSESRNIYTTLATTLECLY